MELWDAYDRNENKLDFDLIRGEPIPAGAYHLVCDTVVRHVDGDYLIMRRDLNKTAYPGKESRIEKAQEMKLHRRYRIVQHQPAKIGDIHIYRIEVKNRLDRLAEIRHRIKNRRQIHEYLRENRIKILRVLKNHKQRRKYQAHPYIEDDQAADRNYQQEKLPGKSHTVKGRKHEEYHQNDQEIDQ